MKTLRIVRLAHIGYVVVECDEGTPQAVTKIMAISELPINRGTNDRKKV